MYHIKIIFLIFCHSLVFGQAIETRSQLSLDRIFNTNDLRQDHFGPHQWLGRGEYYTTIEYHENGNSELILYDSKTSDRRILIPEQKLVDPETGAQINIESYSWSTDENKLLIFTNSQRVWRTNTRGDYYLFDMSVDKPRKLGKGLVPSSMMFAKFNDQGTLVAYVSQNNIYVEDVMSGQIRQLTHDGTLSIINGTFDWAYEEEFFCKDGFRWSPNGKTIAYWQIDATGTKDFLMIDNISDNYSQVIPVQYPKVGQNPSSARIGILNVERAETTWVTIPGDPYQHYIPRIQWLSPDNRLLITQLSRKQNHLNLWAIRPGETTAQKVYEEISDTWIDIVHIDISASWEMQDQIVLDDGHAILWLSEKDGWRHLYKIEMDGGSVRLVSPGNFDIASLKGYDPVSGTVYYIASPDNPTQRYLHMLNIETGKTSRLTPSSFKGLNRYDIAENGKFAIFRSQGSNNPESGYLIALPTHQFYDTLYTSDNFRQVLKELDLPKIEFFQVTTKDGITLDGKMIKPHNFSSGKRYPVLFYVYGEPAGQTAVDRMDDLWHLYLAQQGYMVITLDNRGTPSLKGTKWRKSIYRNIGVINAQDQALAAKEILNWDFVDPDRIGVWGWSGGGAMTLNLLFKYPDIYKTGIAVSAVTNQLFYDNIYQERYMGLPSENLEDFIKGSPASHAAGLEGHLLYIHGTGDDNVHYQNAEFLINALITENKQFDLMIYPNRSHGIYEGPNTTMHLYSTMTRYLRDHLPPGPK